MKNLFKNFSNKEIQKMIDDGINITTETLKEILNERFNDNLYKKRVFISKHKYTSDSLIIYNLNDVYLETLYVKNSIFNMIDDYNVNDEILYHKTLTKRMGDLSFLFNDTTEITTDDKFDLWNKWYNKYLSIHNDTKELYEETISYVDNLNKN